MPTTTVGRLYDRHQTPWAAPKVAKKSLLVSSQSYKNTSKTSKDVQRSSVLSQEHELSESHMSVLPETLASQCPTVSACKDPGIKLRKSRRFQSNQLVNYCEKN